jgi:hypothetical protein
MFHSLHGVHCDTRPRVKLQVVSATLMSCPKCGVTYPKEGFKNPNADNLIRKKKKQKRIAMLKQSYSGGQTPILR